MTNIKYITIAGIALFGASLLAQEVHYDYDRTANFSAFKTYRWVDRIPVAPGNELLDQDIKRAVDAQLLSKGLRRVDSGSDLQLSYQGAISEEKQYDYLDSGPSLWGDTRVITSTIQVGRLVVIMTDANTGHLVWRGLASKSLDLKRDPDKNYRNLEKAMAKLFRNYPPDQSKH